MDSYEKASLKDEFCYCQYSDSTVDYNLLILPPVSNQQGGDSTANALVCTVEARYRKAGICPPALDMKDLLDNLQDLAVRSECFSLDQCILVMRDSLVDLDSDMEPEEVVNDDGTCEAYVQPVVKFGLSRIDHYTLVSKPHKSVSTVSTGDVMFDDDDDDYTLVSKPHKSVSTVSTGNVMKFDDVVKEIKNNGPVIASFLPDWDFSDWSMEYARNCIYEGLYFAELSEPDKKKQRVHLVALIGFGSGEKEYFIAQNSYGLNWGDNGMFRLDPRCVRSVSVPILPSRE